MILHLVTLTWKNIAKSNSISNTLDFERKKLENLETDENEFC